MKKMKMTVDRRDRAHERTVRSAHPNANANANAKRRFRGLPPPVGSGTGGR
jgi:hypothetical protein